MARIAPVTLENTDAATADTLRTVEKKIGMIPNLFATFAVAPAALNGYLALSDALAQGALSATGGDLDLAIDGMGITVADLDGDAASAVAEEIDGAAAAALPAPPVPSTRPQVIEMPRNVNELKGL